MMRTTTDILTWLAMYPDARILSVQGGYALRRPDRPDLHVEDTEFDQLAAQSYIELLVASSGRPRRRGRVRDSCDNERDDRRVRGDGQAR